MIAGPATHAFDEALRRQLTQNCHPDKVTVSSRAALRQSSELNESSVTPGRKGGSMHPWNEGSRFLLGGEFIESSQQDDVHTSLMSPVTSKVAHQFFSVLIYQRHDLLGCSRGISCRCSPRPRTISKRGPTDTACFGGYANLTSSMRSVV
jgi:hypothetical protein